MPILQYLKFDIWIYKGETFGLAINIYKYTRAFYNC